MLSTFSQEARGSFFVVACARACVCVRVCVKGIRRDVCLKVSGSKDQKGQLNESSSAVYLRDMVRHQVFIASRGLCGGCLVSL